MKNPRIRFLLLYVAPVLLLLGTVVWPLATGQKTLYLRDVLNAHYQLETALTSAMRDGYLPLVDPYRGYQPLLGNLNAAPLYPDRLLYLVAPPLWALNAHFWLHLLLAPLAFYAFARAWGLGREASWAAGVCYATSGFFLSQLNLYNLVAGVALLPAFAAALIHTWARTPWASSHPDLPAGFRPRAQRREASRSSKPTGDKATTSEDQGLQLEPSAPAPRRGRPLSRRAPGPETGPSRVGLLIVVSLLWTLLLLAGDPMTAALAFALGLSAAVVRHRRLPDAPLRLLAALACGTLVAAPQLVATAQILPTSYRGFQGYSLATIFAQSWDPRTVLEWLVPFVFGRPNLDFWGHDFFGGHEPFYLTLYPGLLALALVIAAGRPRGAAAFWAWGAIATGIFFALGGFNPLVRALITVSGGAGLRYPIKVWPLVAVGAALLCGLGWARAVGDPSAGGGSGRRRLFRAIGILALAHGALLLLARQPPAILESVWRGRLAPSMLTLELGRWGTLAFLNLLLAVLMLALLWRARRRPALAAGLLVLHAASQLFLLRPAWDLDDAAPYRAPPTLLDSTSEDSRIVHGRVDDLFGPERASPRPRFPDAGTRWAERLRFAELFPQAGIRWRRRYDFDRSPEGLDTFLSVAVAQAIKKMPDRDRLRLLEASGIDTLILDRPLDAGARERAVLARRVPSLGRELHLYRLPHAAPEIALMTTVWTVADPRQALDRLLDPAFDPERMVVIPGPGPDRDRPPGELALVEHGPETVVADVVSPAGAVLTLQRAALPLYRATVDDRPAPVRIANAHRLAVEIPAGEHRVRIWVDRRPLYGSWGLAALGVLGMLALARVSRARRAG